MYDDFFGLDEAPFKITPNPDLFYDGGNRGAILDALHYAVTNGEGIVKIVGEVGSGKTMLSRMLESRLSTNIETIYIANPSLSRDEILYAVAADLGIPLTGQHTTLIIRELQNRLIEKHAAGHQIVVFIDEAQAMPIESLEEIRLLSNLETSTHKLLQIVLFGQPELDTRLNLPQTRQIRERITHSFHLPPLTKPDIRNYLMFRLRAVGYRGPDLFTPSAVRRIARASRGLIRRINILADKALLAAFSENIHQVNASHVAAAIRDSGFKTRTSLRATTTILLLVTIAAIGADYALHAHRIARRDSLLSVIVTEGKALTGDLLPSTAIKPLPIHRTVVITHATTHALSANAPHPATTIPRQIAETTHMAHAPTLVEGDAASAQPFRARWQQTLAATHKWLMQTPANHHTIQLMIAFGTNQIIAWNTLKRIEKELPNRAVYVYPTLAGNQPAFSFVYGDFATATAARIARIRLPAAYQAHSPLLRTIKGIRDELRANSTLPRPAPVYSSMKNPQNTAE